MISSSNSPNLFNEGNQKSPLKLKLMEDDITNNTFLSEYISKCLDIMVDEVCIFENLKRSDCGVKRIVPQDLNKFEDNYVVLGQNFTIVNELEAPNGRFGWWVLILISI